MLLGRGGNCGIGSIRTSAANRGCSNLGRSGGNPRMLRAAPRAGNGHPARARGVTRPAARQAATRPPALRAGARATGPAHPAASSRRQPSAFRLQIVDNLHPPVSNRNMQPVPRPRRASRSPDASARRGRRRPSDRPGSVELAADAGRARARADDRRRRPARGGEAQRDRHRAAPRRVARPRARGVPRAGRVRTRPPREEPWRVRAPDHVRRGRRDLRAARRARRVRRPARRAACDRGRRPRRSSRWSTGWKQAAAARRRRRLPSRSTSRSTTGWSTWPATPSCWRSTAAWSTS